MSVPAYESYHDSGVRWLGAVPEHWRSVPFWSLFRRNKRTGYPEAELLSVYRDYGVIRKSDRDDNHNNPSEDLGTYQLVEPGDLAVNKMKAWQGSLGISPYRGIVSPAYFVYNSKHNEDPLYLHYLLRSAPLSAAFMTISKGIRINQWDVDPDQLRQLPISLPPRSEQSNIAAFLDRETGKIDALVEAQRRLIELLKEKRHAVISHAVTKGLDPTTQMKDSGVEWLGQVPAHWEVVPIGYRYDVQLGRMLNAERADGENLRSYLRVFDVQWGEINVSDLPQMDFPPDAQIRYRLEPGDLLVNEGGSYVGRSAIWRGQLDECYYQKALHRVRPRQSRDTTEYLFFVMEFATKLGVFVCGGNQTTIDHLTAEQLREYRFAFPPLSEQLEIAASLASTTERLETLITEAEAAIRLLQERRSALIAAAVTGKIDVRGLIPKQAEAA